MLPVRLSPYLIHTPAHHDLYRGPHKEDRGKGCGREGADQIQDQVFAVSLHFIDRRPRKGREAQAKFASWCATYSSHSHPQLIIFTRLIGLTVVEVDKTPKKK